ncbi:MAG: alpha-ketoacid dehydrogenase subunit beta [Candidatus Schekmanbacteria bacterium]|nr:MAG: alpha-ketoacid dehydrogenase subunit beta [Candidatus Schekmanbacteria bacterium]
MHRVTYIEAITEALREEMERDERLFMMGEDIGAYGGVFKATKGLQEQFGELRVLDSPLSESLIAGASIGATLVGLKAVPEIQFADFVTPAMDQIIQQAAKLRYRSGGSYKCPVVFRICCGGGIGGGLYHSQSNEAWFVDQPGLKVLAPATPYDAKGLLKAAIRDENPIIYFEHKKLYRSIKQEIPDEDYTVPIGKADIKLEGDNVTVITYSLPVNYALEAAKPLAKDNISIEVVDLRTLLPMDKETMLESVKKTGKVLIVHEANKTGGVGGEIAAIIAEEAFEYLDAPIMRLAGPDVPAVPFAPPMEDFFMVNPKKIEDAVRKLAAY